MKKIACLFINLSSFTDNNNIPYKNYENDNFFTPNAINSFKKWNPDVDVHYINDKNLNEYLQKLQIEEFYENIGLMKIHFAKQLFKSLNYIKVISLGIDTFTCARVDEFINNDEDDLICTAGAFHPISTEHFTTPIESFVENGKIYNDTPFINGDVICINNVKAAETLYDISIKYWSDHAEQGGMNYCYLNQKEVGLKVSIVDYPYYKTKVVYNIRSKGVVGGYCLIKGNVLAGRKGKVISNTYPSLLFYINDNKLYTQDNKQIKIFHYCEGLGYKTDEDELSLEEQIYEMKHKWFNKETIQFLTTQCDCKF
jgi:hypothetical protein